PFPQAFGADLSRFGKWWVLLHLGVDEGAVPGAAAPAGAFRPHDAEDREVVFHGREAGLGGVADHLADLGGLAVALRALPQHDVRVLRAFDGAAAQWQRNHVQVNAEALDALAQPGQSLHGPVLIESP